MRFVLGLCTIVCCTGLLSIGHAATPEGPNTAEPPNMNERPNIVFILADDLGYGDIGCYGATKVHTPNIDRLAEEGRRFTDAHSPSPVCTPTRHNLMTGRYCWRTWAKTSCVWSSDPLLIETDRLTLPALLKQNGYRTGCVGKWHLGFGHPDAEGWDNVLGPDDNLPLKPGPLEVGFDDFFGIPHVGQFPHVLIRDHDIVGRKPGDHIQLVLDQKDGSYRLPYLERPRYGKTPRHTFAGTENLRYEQEDLALRLTKEAVAWIDRGYGRCATCSSMTPLRVRCRYARDLGS